MNTILPSDDSFYPSLQASWHQMIRRCRAGDRRIALQLCRASFREQNGGRFAALGESSDAEIARFLGLMPRQVKRLRESSPLWRWEGNDVLLFFVGFPRKDGQVTPESSGRRRARHANRRSERNLRQARRTRLMPPPAEYPLLDGDDLLAADEDEFGDS